MKAENFYINLLNPSRHKSMRRSVKIQIETKILDHNHQGAVAGMQDVWSISFFMVNIVWSILATLFHIASAVCSEAIE